MHPQAHKVFSLRSCVYNDIRFCEASVPNAFNSSWQLVCPIAIEFFFFGIWNLFCEPDHLFHSYWIHQQITAIYAPQSGWLAKQPIVLIYL